MVEFKDKELWKRANAEKASPRLQDNQAWIERILTVTEINSVEQPPSAGVCESGRGHSLDATGDHTSRSPGLVPFVC